MSLELLSEPWPWYVAGPLIGLMVPVLRLVGGKSFGISSNLRHLCAATVPGRSEFLCYDWRRTGSWNLVFALGIVLGGTIGGVLLASPESAAISETTRAELAALGITSFSGLAPIELYGPSALWSFESLALLIGGGFLVGFGARYAGGCTSGHAITGLADLQLPSLIAVAGFFVGGLAATHYVLPWLLGGAS